MDRRSIPAIAGLLTALAASAPLPAFAQNATTQDLGCDIPTSSFATVVPGGPQDRGRLIVATPQTPCPTLATGDPAGTDALGAIHIEIAPPSHRRQTGQE